MKKTILTFCFGILLLATPAVLKAQRLSFGQYTGINFSNLHGNLTSNRWVPKPGPTAGLIVEYDLGRQFSLQTELNFMKHYYEMKSPKPIYNPYPGPVPLNSFSNCCITDIYYPSYQKTNWDYSFLRLPLLFKYKTPTRLQLALGGGIFYSFLINDDLTSNEKKTAEEQDRRIFPPTHDWGYLFTADLSFPVTNQVNLFISGRLSTGQKIFIESCKAKNGANEILLGFKFTPGQKKKPKTDDYYTNFTDSLFSGWYIKPGVGAILSWNPVKESLGNYSENSGANTGIMLGYQFNKVVSIQTGFQFEQKGYAMDDSSKFFNRFAKQLQNPGYDVDTKVDFDYLTIPLDFRLTFGETYCFYVNVGAYTSFLVNASCRGTAVRTYSGPNYYRVEKLNLNETVEGQYKSADFGFSAGLGFQFPFSDKIKFDIGIRHAGSITNVLKTPDNNEEYSLLRDLSFKNSSLSLQFGLQIPISNK